MEDEIGGRAGFRGAEPIVSRSLRRLTRWLNGVPREFILVSSTPP
jgi:hypothetical protein